MWDTQLESITEVGNNLKISSPNTITLPNDSFLTARTEEGLCVHVGEIAGAKIRDLLTGRVAVRLTE